MKNKTVLITGANAGIGKFTALGLAKQGANIILLCRSKAKGKVAQKEIKQIATGSVELILCDLGDFSSIRQAVAQFTKMHQQLDVLINNAGLITSSFGTTKNGFELQFGVNYLGHFLLTKLLLDHLKAAPSARIIHVSSMIHQNGKIDFDSFQNRPRQYGSMKAYAQSKLCMILFNKELSRRLIDTNITTNALHPGAVATSIANKNTSRLLSFFWSLGKVFFISPQKGAGTSIYLASSPKVEGVTGKYFDNKKEKKTAALADDNELCAKLWEVSEAFIKENKIFV